MKEIASGLFPMVGLGINDDENPGPAIIMLIINSLITFSFRNTRPRRSENVQRAIAFPLDVTGR